MNDEDKTRDQLINELVALRQHITAMETQAIRQAQTDTWQQICTTLIEQAAEAIVITQTRLDPPGPEIVFVNPAFTRMTGYSAEEVLGKSPRILQGPETNRKTLDRLRQNLTEGRPFQGETMNYRKDGSTFVLEWCIIPIEDTTTQTHYFASVQRDITTFKQNAEALRISEERNRALIDAIPDLMFRIRKDGTYLEYNSSRAEDLVIPPSAFLGKTVYEVLPDMAASAMHYLRLALETGEVQVFEHQLMVAGQLRDYEARIVVCGEDEVLSIIRDVTKQKQSERQLKEALADKDRLLRELHHRVKNNLQIISSLLDLQSNLTNDNRTLELLRDNQRRIRAIAFMHESLYQSSNLRHISFAEYVHDLVLYLFQSYQRDANYIVPKINIAPLLLNVERALPCGLIINELVSNALQHAFPEGRSGEIRIELYAEADQLTLIIQDNGIGMPHDFDFERTDMLGLQLVRLLTRQLHGSIKLDSSNGTAMTIIFPHT